MQICIFRLTSEIFLIVEIAQGKTYCAAPSLSRLSLLSSNRTSKRKNCHIIIINGGRRGKNTGTADHLHDTHTNTKVTAASSQCLQHLCQGSEADMVN